MLSMENVVLASTNQTDVTPIIDGESMREILAKYETALPKKGDVLAGEVISVSKKGVLVDLGLLGTGIIYPSEFYDNTSLQKSLKKGEKISVILLELENDEGYRELSLKQAQMTTAWEDIRERKEKGEVISTTILNINKGGLIVEVNGIQGFLPLSQLSPEHYPKVEGGDTSKIVQVLQKFRGQSFNVKILDFSEAEGKLIVSERAIMTDKLREEIDKYKIGDVVDGIITEITDFGAFVKITENLEGLIHISEIDWKIIDNPRDYLTIGQTISAKIINIENDRISLSLKALKTDPWENIEEKFKVGQTVEGELVKITNYGLLIKITDEIMGLIPSSELINRKEWERPSGERGSAEHNSANVGSAEASRPNVPQVGEKITVAIVSIDAKEHKMLLTIQASQ